MCVKEKSLIRFFYVQKCESDRKKTSILIVFVEGGGYIFVRLPPYTRSSNFRPLSASSSPQYFELR